MPQTTEIKDMVQTLGTERTIVIILLSFLVVYACILLNEYKKDKTESRKEAREKKERDLEINKNYIEMIKQMTEVITKNSDDMTSIKEYVSGFKGDIKAHTQVADKNFTKVNKNLDDLKVQVKEISKDSENFATKQGLKNIEEKLDEVQFLIKK